MQCIVCCVWWVVCLWWITKRGAYVLDWEAPCSMQPVRVHYSFTLLLCLHAVSVNMNSDDYVSCAGIVDAQLLEENALWRWKRIKCACALLQYFMWQTACGRVKRIQTERCFPWDSAGQWMSIILLFHKCNATAIYPWINKIHQYFTHDPYKYCW